MGELTVQETQLREIHTSLGGLLKSKIDALPADFNETRFLQNCMTVLQETKNIEAMDATSVARTMLRGAFLGLDFFTKECYAIPYNKNLGTKDSPNWVRELQFQTDYKGEVKLAKKYSINPIKDIYAKVVKDGDVFDEKIEEGNQIINFYPRAFSNNEIIGAFAIVLYRDGSMEYDTMSTLEIEDTRNNFSKAKDSKAWTKSTGEMYKKTVLRRLCKHIDLDFASQEQYKAFEEASDFEMTSKKKPEQAAASSLDVIDVEIKEGEIDVSN